MVRMKESDPAEVLALAVQAFKRHGYHAASFHTLTDEMGIDRASLYATYGDKRALFRAALGRYSDGIIASVVDRLEEVAP